MFVVATEVVVEVGPFMAVEGAPLVVLKCGPIMETDTDVVPARLLLMKSSPSHRAGSSCMPQYICIHDTQYMEWD